MTTALRKRIDAVESFAADVAHELKNPLASLRSALESLDKVDDPDLRRQLSGIAAHDVRRIDRLVTEIADASRIDAELSRTTFGPVDMARLVQQLAAARKQSGVDGDCDVQVSLMGIGGWEVAGDAPRLERVLENLLDNAVSFSPPGGAIAIDVTRDDERVEIAVTDEGPGIPAEAREKIFERFHSLRPESETFGSHSGLGLAIARTIVEAHDGSLTAREREDGHVRRRSRHRHAGLGGGKLMQPHQATCVAIGGRGVLIEGPPGSGKSSLALALIDRGGVLIGDDGVLLEARGGVLFAHPHPNTRGLIEVRNLGLLTCPVAEEATVALVIRLDESAPRFIETPEATERGGVALPLVALWPHSPVLHLRAELALERFGLG